MRLIRSGALSPELNLALDEALLRAGTETLRLYAWDPPGLSLGFFQRAAEFECPPGFRLVRRPTGGGAIAHIGELTIALIGRRRRVDAVYREINAWVTAAVGKLGITVAPGEGEPEAAPAGLCFDTHTRYDLLARGRKVFGSAQRRGGDRFLLHGSLVLEPNPLARGAVSVAELAGRPVGRAEMEQAVVAAVQETTGAALRAAAPTAEEWADAHRLVSRRYGCDAWTCRR
ncbi:MAG: lipoate--protein ligase family protein [Planctomycetota bacterium]